MEKGAKIATLQLQKTKDGQLVCFSDPTVERVTTGKGAVKDLTLAELRQLTVREYQGPAERQKIPTLREALDFAKGKILLAVSSDAYLAEAQQVAKEAQAEELLIFTGEQAPDAGWMYIPVVDLGQADALARIDKALAKKPVAVELHYADDANPLLPEALQIPHSFTIVPGADHNPVEIFDESVNVYDTSFWDAAFHVE